MSMVPNAAAFASHSVELIWWESLFIFIIGVCFYFFLGTFDLHATNGDALVQDPTHGCQEWRPPHGLPGSGVRRFTNPRALLIYHPRICRYVHFLIINKVMVWKISGWIDILCYLEWWKFTKLDNKAFLLSEDDIFFFNLLNLINLLEPWSLLKESGF